MEIDFISNREAERLAPWYAPAAESCTWFAPGDLYFEFPDSVPRAYMSSAVECGARYRREKVNGLRVDGDRVRAVETQFGEVGGDAFVLATGAWTRTLSSNLGYRAPVWPVRHQLLITEPIAGVRREQPSVRFVEAKTYTRPHVGGLLFGGYEKAPWAPRAENRPPNDVCEIPLSERVLRRLVEQITDVIPALGRVVISEIRGGLPTMTPDGLFIVDRVPGTDNAYLLSGCNVAGFSSSPALGKLLARWILEGHRPDIVLAFSLDRLDESYSLDERMRDAARTMYSDKFSYEELRQH